jgi:hypothetical protein
VKTRQALVAIALGAYLMGIGILAGMALDRMRFDEQRTAMLARYEQSLREWQTYRVALEKDATRTRDDAGVAPLVRMLRGERCRGDSGNIQEEKGERRW